MTVRGDVGAVFRMDAWPVQSAGHGYRPSYVVPWRAPIRTDWRTTVRTLLHWLQRDSGSSTIHRYTSDLRAEVGRPVSLRSVPCGRTAIMGVDSPSLRAITPAVARQVMIDMRTLRITCSTCTDTASGLSWPDASSPTPRPTCPKHTYPNHRDLPSLTNLQLAMLWLVADRPGSSTVDLANRGSASWTVRGAGVVLSRLERAGLVSAGRTGAYRAWYQTGDGRAISAHVQPAPPSSR